MKVRDVMTPDVKSCAPEMSLAAAARILREQSCGALPVVQAGKTMAMLTDRDICLVLAARDRRPSEMRVDEAMSTAVHFVREHDPVGRALQLMRRWRVRRLPVLDMDGTLKGIVTLNDIALKATPGGNGGPSWADLVNTFQAICERQRAAAPQPRSHSPSLHASL